MDREGLGGMSGGTFRDTVKVRVGVDCGNRGNGSNPMSVGGGGSGEGSIFF